MIGTGTVHCLSENCSNRYRLHARYRVEACMEFVGFPIWNKGRYRILRGWSGLRPAEIVFALWRIMSR
jgi:hypothetical protein